MPHKKVVLAYSGGLDTTYCAVYLKQLKDMEVHALTVNTGGFSEEEILQIEKRAHELGVASFTCVDVSASFNTRVSDCDRPSAIFNAA